MPVINWSDVAHIMELLLCFVYSGWNLEVGFCLAKVAQFCLTLSMALQQLVPKSSVL